MIKMSGHLKLKRLSIFFFFVVVCIKVYQESDRIYPSLNYEGGHQDGDHFALLPDSAVSDG